MPRTSGRLALALISTSGLAAPALAQLRVANWNVSLYPSASQSARDAAFKTAIYGSFEGRSMSPDIIACQEFVSSAGLTSFKSMLNSSPGGPTDWEHVPWLSGADSQSTVFYRTSKVTFLSFTTIAPGGGSPAVPRNVNVAVFRLAGYSGNGATFSIYPSHMKSGGTADDLARRLLEAQYIRGHSNARPAGQHFLYGGDTNIPTSSQDAWQELVAASAPFNTMPGGAPNNTRGQFFDPIKTPGSWNNNSTYRLVHTQAPGGTAGMDDRFDVLLLDAGLIDGKGFEYIGNANIAFNSGATATWNDPNHSFRAWGNDGTSFNSSLKVAGNTMVGPTIAQALIDTAVDDGTTGGHLPVFLDLRVPGTVSAPAVLNFGSVNQNSTAQTTLTVANGGNVALWNAAGISVLPYALSASAGVTAPVGSFTASAGAAGNSHQISINTSVPGPFSGTVTITPSDGDTPAFVVSVQATVVAAPPPCYPNCDGSTESPILNVNDFTCFLQKYAGGDSYANCDGSTMAPTLNVADFTCFLQAYTAGCP